MLCSALLQVRRSFRSLSYEELVRWSDVVVRGLDNLRNLRAVQNNDRWDLENYLEVVHERSTRCVPKEGLVPHRSHCAQQTGPVASHQVLAQKPTRS